VIGLTPIAPPGVSLIGTAGAYSLIAFALVVGLVGALAVARASAEPSPLLRPLLAYLAAVLLATLCGFAPKVGILFAAIAAIAVSAHLAIARYYRSALVCGGIYCGYLCGGIVASVLALVMVLTRVPAALYTVGHGRAIGTFVVSGELAGYLLLLIPTAAGVALVTSRRWLRILALGAAVSGACALVATFSRAGWLGALAGAVFLLFALRRRAVALALAAAALLAIGLVFAFDAHHNPSENFTRLAIWRTGLRTLQLFPLTGVGPGGFQLVYPALRPPDGEPTAFHAHNFLLTSFAEMGVLGFAATLALWGSFAFVLRKLLRNAEPRARTLALSLAAGYVATGVQSLFDVVQVLALGVWIPFMAVALGAARYGLVEPVVEQ
jgi:O-antigen ligase